MWQRATAVGVVVGVLAAVLVGCGADQAAPPQLSLGASATWHSAPAVSLGYTVAVVFLQQPAQGASGCAALPESTRIRVNGAEIASSLDSSGCLDTSMSLGPYLQVPAITVEVEERGELIGQARFDQLAPGAAASLTVPADGQVRAGDEIVVVPPPELPTSVPSTGTLCPLDPASHGGTSSCVPLGRSLERLADGLHASMPAFTGRAAVFFAGTPSVPDARFSCSGFAACVAIADGTLGPLFVTGVP
jgi:hypothetical protein